MTRTKINLKHSNHYKYLEYNYRVITDSLSRATTNYYLTIHFHEINTHLANFIHTFTDFLNRIVETDKPDSLFLKTYNFTEDDLNFFNSFRYVSNQLKHDYTLELFTNPLPNKEGDYSYPYLYREKPVILWNNFYNKETNKYKYRKQYDKYLNGKEIEDTIRRLYELINKL